LEQTHKLLNAIINLHIMSDTGGDLPPSVLNHLGKFTEFSSCTTLYDCYLPLLFRTLHKIHTFVEAQQNGSKIKNFFHQGETNILLKDCNAGLQLGVVFFQVSYLTGMPTAD
jgi:hypothetical protein